MKPNLLFRPPGVGVGPNLTRNPLSNFFPEMGSNDRTALEDSMRTNGFLPSERICIIGDPETGSILDGWNRYCAAKAVGIDLSTVTWEQVSGDHESLTRLFYNRNAARRHLTATQKALAYAAVQDRLPNPDTEESTVEDMAKKAGVNRKTMGNALRLTKANPKTADKVRRGEIPARPALRQEAKVRKSHPKERASSRSEAEFCIRRKGHSLTAFLNLSARCGGLTGFQFVTAAVRFAEKNPHIVFPGKFDPKGAVTVS